MREIFLLVRFTNCLDNFCCHCTTINRLDAWQLKLEFCNSICFIRGLHLIPWIICGNFNAIISPQDKRKGAPNLVDLVDTQVICVKFDCFLLSHSWSSLYPRTYQFSLPRFGSSHTPLCLEFGAHISWAHVFSFEKSWYSNENLGTLIQD